jgi:hypothetical protein
MAAQSTYKMFDAFTGNWILSIVNATSMQLTSDDNGDLVGYFVSSNSTGRYLNMWNSTRCINIGQGGSYYGGGHAPADNWMWRPAEGSIIDFKLGHPVDSTHQHHLQWQPNYLRNLSHRRRHHPNELLCSAGAATSKAAGSYKQATGRETVIYSGDH